MQNTNGDPIGTLYQLYEQPMYFEAYRILHEEYLAEDAVHEAFLRLIRNRGKFTDPQSPQTRSYVFKTVRSAALDLYRKQKNRQQHCLALDETVENTVISDESAENVPGEMLSALPPKYAAVMRCLFIDGLSIRETASVLRISEALVRKRCERARKYLKRADAQIEKEVPHAK